MPAAPPPHVRNRPVVAPTGMAHGDVARTSRPRPPAR